METWISDCLVTPTFKMGEVPSNNLILVTNIAPQATRDQMNTLFGFVGRVDELKLYPSIRDASINVDCRCCFVRFNDPSCVPITQHLNNTVFIDRAIIITPVVYSILISIYRLPNFFLSNQISKVYLNTNKGDFVSDFLNKGYF